MCKNNRYQIAGGNWKRVILPKWPERKKKTQSQFASRVLQTRFSTLKRIFNPSKAGALSKVLVPTITVEESITTWTTEFEVEALEQALLKHCHSHYRKAAITQFGHGSMKYLLGFNGLTEAADQILEGTLFHNTDNI